MAKKTATPIGGVRAITANPSGSIPVEMDPENTPVFTTIDELTEYRLKQLETSVTKQADHFDAHRTAMGEAFKEVNTSITDLAVQVAGLTGTLEATSNTVSQAMEIVTASAKGSIQINTAKEVTILEESADAKKTRRAFSLKLLAIAGTIATAIATAIAAGRC